MDNSALFSLRTFAFLLSAIVTKVAILSSPAAADLSDDSMQHAVLMVKEKPTSTDQHHVPVKSDATRNGSDIPSENSLMMKLAKNLNLDESSPLPLLEASSTLGGNSIVFSGNGDNIQQNPKDSSTSPAHSGQQDVDIENTEASNSQHRELKLSEGSSQLRSSTISVLAEDNFLPDNRFTIMTTAEASRKDDSTTAGLQNNEIASYHKQTVMSWPVLSPENIASRKSFEQEITSLVSIASTIKELSAEGKSTLVSTQTQTNGLEPKSYTNQPTALTPALPSTAGADLTLLEGNQATTVTSGSILATTHFATSPVFMAASKKGSTSSGTYYTTEKLQGSTVLDNQYLPVAVEGIDEGASLNTVSVTKDHINEQASSSVVKQDQGMEHHTVTNAGHVEKDRNDGSFLSRLQPENHLFTPHQTTQHYATSQVGYDIYMEPTENVTVSTFVKVLYPNKEENAHVAEWSVTTKQELTASSLNVSSTKYSVTLMETSWTQNDKARTLFPTFTQLKEITGPSKATQSDFMTEGTTYFPELLPVRSKPTLPKHINMAYISTTQPPNDKLLPSLSSFPKSSHDTAQISSTEPGGDFVPHTVAMTSALTAKSTSTPNLLAHQISTKMVPHHKAVAGTSQKPKINSTATPTGILRNERADGEGQTSTPPQVSSLLTQMLGGFSSSTGSSEIKTSHKPALNKDPQITDVPVLQMPSAGTTIQSATATTEAFIRAQSTSGSWLSATLPLPEASTANRNQKEDSEMLGSTTVVSERYTVTHVASIMPSSTSRARGSGRRATVKGTTQKVLLTSRPLLTLADGVSKNLSSSRPCNGFSGACTYEVSNRTLLQWNDLKRTLSFTWEMHIYGTGILFLILSLISLINLIGSPLLHVPGLPFIMVTNVLLFLIGCLRAIFLFTDPYGTTFRLSPNAVLLFYNITFPLIVSAFAILVVLILKIARFQILPTNIKSLALLVVVIVLHVSLLFGGDLFFFLLNPAINVVLQVVSVSWATFLMVGYLATYFRLRQNWDAISGHVPRTAFCNDDTHELQIQERILRQLQTSARVLMVSGVFGLLCCGLQVYATLWLYGVLGNKGEFSWSWWFLQFCYRIFELAVCFAMSFVASYPFCQQHGRAGHTCWSKIVCYFYNRSKTEIPEYPNNCYDWASGPQDRASNNDISKNIIRNQPENVPLQILKDNNENRAKMTYYKNGGSVSSLIKPKGTLFSPKSHNSIIGRSYSSIGFDKESFLSFTDFDLRPPSPINLSRSIDDALFREHLVKDSIFQNSSLQYPSYLLRQDSCSSLRENSMLNETNNMLPPADFKRRSSDPDYLYSMARCSSPTSVSSPNNSNQCVELHKSTAASIQRGPSGSSLGSLSKGSIKISWNPWRHGASSAETIPSEDMSSMQFLSQDINMKTADFSSETEDTEREARRSFIEISKRIDEQSLSSDTIEL